MRFAAGIRDGSSDRASFFVLAFLDPNSTSPWARAAEPVIPPVAPAAHNDYGLTIPSIYREQRPLDLLTTSLVLHIARDHSRHG